MNKYRPYVLPVLLPTLFVAAYWPVVYWFALRIRHSAQDSSEVFALALAAGLMFLRRQKMGEPAKIAGMLVPAIVGTLVYAALYPWLLDEVQGVLMATTGALLLSPLWLGKRYSLGLHGLLLLAQPLIPVFQYQLGYPLRATCAKLAAGLLQLGQLDVSANGTALEWAGNSVYVDAPCSGIRMLWSGMLLTFALAMILDLGTLKTIALAVTAFASILMANALRASALFYLESGLIKGPAWMHEGVGLVSFGFVGVTLLGLTVRLSRAQNRPIQEVSCAA